MEELENSNVEIVETETTEFTAEEDAINKATAPKEMKVDLKSVIRVCILLFAIIIFAGVLTYVVKPGIYGTFDANGKVIFDATNWHFLEESELSNVHRVPWYRWLTVPIESFFLNSNRVKIYEITGLILILGGCFKVLEVSGGMQSLIKMIIAKFKKKRFGTIWVVTLLMMLLASLFGLQDDLLIMFPIFLSFATAMNWSPVTAIALVLISTGTGFTVAISNPYSMGVIKTITGISVFTKVWFRLIMFAIIYVLTSLFLVRMAKKDEAKAGPEASINDEYLKNIKLTKQERTKGIYIISLFAFVLAVMIIFSVIPSLSKLGLDLVVMAVGFVVGTVVFGRIMIGSWKEWIKAFWKGIKNVAASTLIVIVAFSIQYLAEKACIIHTIGHYVTDILGSMSPYLAVIVLLLFILLIEFFIPSASSKAALLIPILTLVPIAGLSNNVIILTYLLGDGYTNVLYPTCGTLIIGLSLAGVSYKDWVKRTGLFQLVLFGLSIVFLVIAVAIKL